MLSDKEIRYKMTERRVGIRSCRPEQGIQGPFTTTWVKWSGGGVKNSRELLVGSDPTGEEENTLRGPYVKPTGQTEVESTPTDWKM